MPYPLPEVLAFFARKSWWTNNSALGQRWTGPLPPTDNFVQQIVGIDNFGAPQMMTVQLDRLQLEVAPLGNADVRAEITWGNGGVSNTIYCDWQQGTQVSLVATSLRVSVRSFRPDPANTYIVGTSRVALMAAIGAYPRPGAHSPVYTERVQVPDGSSADSVVPPFAKRVTILASGTASQVLYGAGLTTLQLDQSALPFYAQPTDSTPILLRSGTGNRVRVANGTGILANIVFLYELGL